jgi:hypothetical protein
MPPHLPTTQLRTDRGAVSWVTLLLLALLVCGAYLAWVWGPVLILNVEAKQVVRDYINQAVKNTDDAALVQNMTVKLAALDETVTTDERGKRQRQPTIVVDPSAVTWERNTDGDPPTLHVAFSYHRTIELPYLKRWVERDYVIDLTEEISRPNWGPPR